MSRQYNHIHRQLVSDDSDIVGAIAYSLYKKEKSQFVENFKAKHDGKDPEENDIAAFHDAVSTESNKERLKLQASQVLCNFMDSTFKLMKTGIEDDCVKRHKEMIAEAVRPAMPESRLRQYLHGSLQSLIGAVAFMLLMAVLVFTLSLSESEYSFTIGGDGGAKIEKKINRTDTADENETLSVQDTTLKKA